MPVDPLRLASLQTSDTHEKNGLLLRVLLVVGVVGQDLQPVADELRGPVALLAGLAGRTQALDGSRDRARVKVECHRYHLPRAGQLRFDEPTRAGTDVAGHALHARVRGFLVGRVLGVHHRMTGSAAETDRVHDLDALVRREREDDDVDEGEREKEQGQPPCVVGVEIDDRKRRGRFAARGGAPGAATFHGDPERDERQTKDEEPWQDEERNDPEVGAALVSQAFHTEQREEKNRCRVISRRNLRTTVPRSMILLPAAYRMYAALERR